jgi:hypothetical protein
VLDALSKRQSLLLSPQEWRRFLRTDGNGELGEFDALINMTGDALALIEETESFLSYLPKVGIEERSIALIQAYTSAIQRLHRWQERVRKASDKPLYWAVPSKLSHRDDESGDIQEMFPLVLEFQTLNTAILLIFSWAVLLQIYCSVIRLASLLPDAQGTHLDDTTPSYNVQFDIDEAEKVVRLLCQSLEYFHRIDLGFLAPQATTYPSWILKSYLKHRPGHEKELKWCEEFKNLRGPGSRCQVVMMMFSGPFGTLGDAEEDGIEC